MGYGLALAGGGTRGAAHAGVLLALEEENLLPEAIGGTSAGCIVAGCFACGMRPKELCRVVRELAECGMEYLDPDLWALLCMVPQLILGKQTKLSGILKGKCFRKLFLRLTGSQRIEDLPYPLLIPSVDLISGNTICFTNLETPLAGTETGTPGGEQPVKWQNSGLVGDIMMASCSVPGVFRPVHLNGFCLVDGGVTNNLPVDLMRTAGIENVVAVDIGSDYEMPEDQSVFEILSHSFHIMSSSLKDCRSIGECLLLNPELNKKAGLLTFDHMVQCMEDAYHYTKENADRIREVAAGRCGCYTIRKNTFS